MADTAGRSAIDRNRDLAKKERSPLLVLIIVALLIAAAVGAHVAFGAETTTQEQVTDHE